MHSQTNRLPQAPQESAPQGRVGIPISQKSVLSNYILDGEYRHVVPYHWYRYLVTWTEISRLRNRTFIFGFMPVRLKLVWIPNIFPCLVHAGRMLRLPKVDGSDARCSKSCKSMEKNIISYIIKSYNNLSISMDTVMGYFSGCLFYEIWRLESLEINRRRITSKPLVSV